MVFAFQKHALDWRRQITATAGSANLEVVLCTDNPAATEASAVAATHATIAPTIVAAAAAGDTLQSHRPGNRSRYLTARQI